MCKLNTTKKVKGKKKYERNKKNETYNLTFTTKPFGQSYALVLYLRCFSHFFATSRWMHYPDTMLFEETLMYCQ